MTNKTGGFGVTFSDMRVGFSVEWGKYPMHTVRYITVTVGAYTLLHAPFDSQTREKAIEVLGKVLGSRSEFDEFKRALGGLPLNAAVARIDG